MKILKKRYVSVIALSLIVLLGTVGCISRTIVPRGKFTGRKMPSKTRIIWIWEDEFWEKPSDRQ